MNRKMKTGFGFSMAEALCALLCFVLMASLSCLLLKSARSAAGRASDSASGFFVLQLRQFAAVQDFAEVKNGELLVSSANGTFRIFQDQKNRLVKTRTISNGGYEILLEGISRAVFVQTDSRIYLEVSKDGKTERWQIV